MKRSTIYTIGLVVSLLVAFLGTFGSEPTTHLWHWFGYDFGISTKGVFTNIVPKISAAVFILLMLIDPFKKKEEVSN
jgi:hypothetical protein